jgi:arsenate reductase
MRRMFGTAIVASLAGTVTAVPQQPPIAAADRSIVFVCEHGAALSVIATTLFNKLAAERGLPQRAIYRGVNPQADLSVATLKGLRDDGLLPPTDKPALITAIDIAAATYIFSIGCPLPPAASSSGKAEDWSDVPQVSDGYGAARDAIRRHVEHLIDQLRQRSPQDGRHDPPVWDAVEDLSDSQGGLYGQSRPNRLRDPNRCATARRR